MLGKHFRTFCSQEDLGHRTWDVLKYYPGVERLTGQVSILRGQALKSASDFLHFDHWARGFLECNNNGLYLAYFISRELASGTPPI